MPVVMFFFASIDTVKLHPVFSVFLSTIGLRSSLFAISCEIETQISPRHSFIMKFIFSGVVFSAAKIISPSFSLSSSSTTITILPDLKSDMDFWMSIYMLSLTNLAILAVPSSFSTVISGFFTKACFVSEFSSRNFLSLPFMMFSQIFSGLFSLFNCSTQISFSFSTVVVGISSGVMYFGFMAVTCIAMLFAISSVPSSSATTVPNFLFE